MDYIYKRELTENERMAELDANIKRGNHKSATSRLEDLLSKVKRDVDSLWLCPSRLQISSKIYQRRHGPTMRIGSPVHLDRLRSACSKGSSYTRPVLLDYYPRCISEQ